MNRSIRLEGAHRARALSNTPYRWAISIGGAFVVVAGCASKPADQTGGTKTDLTPATSVGDCGAAPVGSTCKSAGGGCVPLVCSEGRWRCAAGLQEVALTPSACGEGDGNDGDPDTDAGTCASAGLAPVGVTCRTAVGGCVALTCLGGQWRCAADEVQVPLTPSACRADGGSEAGP